MSRLTIPAILLAASLLALGSYRAGTGQWPGFSRQPEVKSAPAPSRKAFYWRDPDGKADYSATEKTTPDGRAYLPVYEDAEPSLAAPKVAEVGTAAKPATRKILYYRNPMGLPDTSPTPKKDSMGMAYVPVYEGDEPDDGTTFKVSLDRVQRAGVRTEAAAMRRLTRPVRAPAVARLDERSLRIVSLRSDGFIEKLYVNESGKEVKAGEPLFRVYSPQMVSAQVDYRTAATGGRGPRDELAAVQRLKNLNVPDAVISSLRENPTPQMSIDWPAPASGVVMEKKVIEGQMAKAGEELFRIADLSRLWVIADLNEQDLGLVEVGATARVTFHTYPNDPRQGSVTFILHEIEAKTRTAKVRIEIANPDHRLKHEMYADVVIETGAGIERLAVPSSAIIDSGRRQIVLLDRGGGRFEPRTVKLGVKSDDHVEVTEGLKVGDAVVVSANFLLDAESNLKAALKGFTADTGAPAAPAHQH